MKAQIKFNGKISGDIMRKSQRLIK